MTAMLCHCDSRTHEFKYVYGRHIVHVETLQFNDGLHHLLTIIDRTLTYCACRCLLRKCRKLIACKLIAYANLMNNIVHTNLIVRYLFRPLCYTPFNQRQARL